MHEAGSAPEVNSRHQVLTLRCTPRSPVLTHAPKAQMETVAQKHTQILVAPGAPRRDSVQWAQPLMRDRILTFVASGQPS